MVSSATSAVQKGRRPEKKRKEKERKRELILIIKIQDPY